jgi:probable rRNA maturation factor
MIDIDIDDERWAAAVPDAEGLVREAAEAALAGERGSQVSVLLTNDETVRQLNDRFRGKDAATNVLSFPALENPEGFLGDIALAFGVCEREAAEQGKSLAHHLQHLVAHGALHLVGYDHQTDAEAEAMEALEREILSGLGVPDPYAATGQGDHG